MAKKKKKKKKSKKVEIRNPFVVDAVLKKAGPIKNKKKEENKKQCRKKIDGV